MSLSRRRGADAAALSELNLPSVLSRLTVHFQTIRRGSRLLIIRPRIQKCDNFQFPQALFPVMTAPRGSGADPSWHNPH